MCTRRCARTTLEWIRRSSVERRAGCLCVCVVYAFYMRVRVGNRDHNCAHSLALTRQIHLRFTIKSPRMLVVAVVRVLDDRSRIIGVRLCGQRRHTAKSSRINPTSVHRRRRRKRMRYRTIHTPYTRTHAHT